MCARVSDKQCVTVSICRQALKSYLFSFLSFAQFFLCCHCCYGGQLNRLHELRDFGKSECHFTQSMFLLFALINYCREWNDNKQHLQIIIGFWILTRVDSFPFLSFIIVSRTVGFESFVVCEVSHLHFICIIFDRSILVEAIEWCQFNVVLPLYRY